MLGHQKSVENLHVQLNNIAIKLALVLLKSSLDLGGDELLDDLRTAADEAAGVGEGVDVAPHSTIGPNVVLGDHAKIKTSAQVSETVMWANTVWDSGEELRGAIVYSGGVHKVD